MAMDDFAQTMDPGVGGTPTQGQQFDWPAFLQLLTSSSSGQQRGTPFAPLPTGPQNVGSGVPIYTLPNQTPQQQQQKQTTANDVNGYVKFIQGIMSSGAMGA